MGSAALRWTGSVVWSTMSPTRFGKAPMTEARRGPSPTSPPAADGPTPAAFVQWIVRSRLLDRPHLDAIIAAAPAPARASSRLLADYLIEIGELTHYQT